jgi:hypothetical protein
MDLKKKKLIKEVLEYYRNSTYPLYIYQVIYNGEVKHVSSRVKDVNFIDLSKRDSYYKTTIQEKTGHIHSKDIRQIFSINDFVEDICRLNSPSEFIFPKIESEVLYNLNLYFLCLDYKTTCELFNKI